MERAEAILGPNWPNRIHGSGQDISGHLENVSKSQEPNGQTGPRPRVRANSQY